MARYHINPTTGEAGACRAKQGNCPFTSPSEHYETKEEAMKAYERIMETGEKPLSWYLSKRGEVIVGPEDHLAFIKECYTEAQDALATMTREEERAIRRYTVTGFEILNALLRHGKVDSPKGSFYERYPDHLNWLINDIKPQIPLMKALIDRQPNKPRVLYRYSSPVNGDIRGYLESIQEAGVYQDAAFMSASAAVDYPLFKTLTSKKEQRFLIELVVNKSLPLQPDEKPIAGDIQSLESEYLVNSGVEFEVIGVEYRKPVTFGGLKEILLENRRVSSKAPLARIHNKNTFRVPVLKIAERVKK